MKTSRRNCRLEYPLSLRLIIIFKSKDEIRIANSTLWHYSSSSRFVLIKKREQPTFFQLDQSSLLLLSFIIYYCLSPPVFWFFFFLFFFQIMILLTQDYSCCLFAFAYIILSTATLATTQTLSSSSGDQFGLLPGSTEPEPQPEINTSLLDGSSQESALLVDYGDDGVTNVLPPLNIPVPDIFPIRFPKFIDPTGLLRWLRKPQKSNCDNGKSLFCCQLGPPRPLLDPNTPYESPERLAERQTRMRECVPCKEYH